MTTPTAPTVWGLDEIAELFGVTWQTVAGWTQQHQDTVPTPDWVSPRGPDMVWLPTREAEWRQWYADRTDGPVPLMSVAGVGRLFGVSAATVSQWVNRYAGTPTPTPRPDFTVGGDRGWLREREQEWRDWHASRPGRGAGGGRPWPARTAE